MKSVAVFCGASTGSDPAFAKAARDLGGALASAGIEVIFGGGNCGLMGLVADSTMAAGGVVRGFIPRFMKDREVAHLGLTELVWVESMHERKTKMFEHSEGFIALPGGIGTLEEIIEVFTWRALNLHAYPIAFLNVNGFYDSLKALFATMESGGLLKPEVHRAAIFADTIEDLLRQIR